MLHMSSTHQMQQIHPNDLSLICPYVGVMGVRVRCSLPETGLEQAKKTQPITGNGQFSKKYGSGQGGGKKKNFDTGWDIFFRG